jgi:hypothetical protein
MPVILSFIDPAEGQQPAEYALPTGDKRMRGMLEPPLETGPHRPQVKQTPLGPVPLPQSMDFSQIVTDADINHGANSLLG